MESPTIDIEQVLLQFSLSSHITGLCVDSDIMVVAATDRVHRIDLATPARVTTATLPPRLTVSGVWQHPSGNHLLVYTGGAVYYLHALYSAFKPLPKFKGLAVLAIAFTRELGPTTDSTGDFLVATTDGSLYAANVKSHAANHRDNKKDDKYLRLVYKLPQGHFTSIHFSAHDMRIVGSSSTNDLYTWDCFGTSASDLSAVFKTGKPEVLDGDKFVIASNGVSFAALDVNSRTIVSNDKEISLASEKRLAVGVSAENVENLIITSHHLIFANENVVAVNKLTPDSQQSTLTESLVAHLPKGDTLLGITADYTRATYWLYSQTAIYELILRNELALVWHSFFTMQRYDEALDALKQLDLDQAQLYYRRNMVLIKQGYHLLQQGQFGVTESEIAAELQNLQARGAKALAQLTEPFEKVCLMLMSHQNLLLTYLMEKLAMLNKPPRNLIKLTVLLSWIVELLLRQVDLEEFPDARAHFDKFVQANLQLLDRQTIYQLGRDMSCFEPIIYYANLLGDYQYIVAHHIDRNDWKRAVEALLNMYRSTKDCEAFYSTSTVLLANAPRLAIGAWLQIDDADYEKFLPAILAYCSSDENMPVDSNCALEFMHAVIFDKQVRSRSFNDHYVALLAAYPAQDQTLRARVSRHLVRFLNHVYYDLVPLGKKSLQCYDSGFALRLCIENAQYHAAIIILVHETQQYKEALALALENDLVELAELVLKQYDKVDCNHQSSQDSMLDHLQMEEELFQSRKQLWLRYAQYLIDRAYKGDDLPNIYRGSVESSNNEQVGNVTDGESSIKDEISTTEDNFSKQENSLKVDSSLKTVDESRMNAQDLKSIKSVETTCSVKDAIEHVRNGGNDMAVPSQVAGLKRLNGVLRYILRLSSSGHGNILGLKDLLPLLPQSITINHFKSEIVKSLNGYNDKINDLGLEMRNSLAITTTLKHRLANAPNDAHVFEAGKACMLCERLLLDAVFIYFPNCTHGFHKECLVKHYIHGHYQFQKLYRDYKALKSENPSKTSELQGPIETILTKECPLCNDANIALLDKPMVDLVKDSGAIKEWEI